MRFQPSLHALLDTLKRRRRRRDRPRHISRDHHGSRRRGLAAGESDRGAERRGRWRLLAVAASLLIAAWSTTYFASAAIMMRGFAGVEETAGRDEMARIIAAIGDRVDKLDFIAADWAGWDATYDYVRTGNPAFDGELADASIAAIDVDALIIADSLRRVRFATGYDRTGKRKIPLPAAIARVATDAGILDHDVTTSVRRGIVASPDGLVLLASRPILTSEKRGPIRGTLVFGRYLRNEIAGIEALAGRRLVVRAIDGPRGVDFQVAAEQLAAGRTAAFSARDDATMFGYAQLLDLHDVPVAIVRGELPRPIYQQASATLQTLFAIWLAIGLLLGGATLWFLDRALVSRVARAESELRYRAVVEQASDAILVVDRRSGAILEANLAAVRLTGYDDEQLRGRSVFDVLEPIAGAALTRDAEDARALAGSRRLRRRDGTMTDVEIAANAVANEGRAVTSLVMRDVGERLRAEAALRESQERYSLAARGANDGLWDWNLATDQIYLSPRWKEMLGFEDAEIGSRANEWFDRIHPDDLPMVQTKLAAHLDGASHQFECEHRMLHRDGDYRWMLARALAVRQLDGKAYRIAGSFTDTTDRKVIEAQLLHDAFHDALTELPNRALFLDRLGQALQRRHRHRTYHFAVLFMDVDRFKRINDGLGHGAGDDLLVHIADRLRASVRPGDTIARFGGDEFAILADDLTDVSDAVRLADRVLEAISAAFHIGGHEVVTTSSIGIAPVTVETTSAESILRDADTAMYRAKALGRGRTVVFTAEMHQQVMALLKMETDLRKSLGGGDFELHYQPIVDLATNRLAGLEALLRWRHGERGLVSPAEFLEVAEETGLVVPIGQRVLEDACRQIRALQIRFPRVSPWVSVNLSYRQLVHPGLVQHVTEILANTGLPANALVIEVTETAISETEEAASILWRLKRLGVKIAIDDFGTGYSSLSALRHYPVDFLKIDRSIVTHVTDDPEKREIVRAIVTLGRTLRHRMVAEGIESEREVNELRALGCDLGQGYHYARPLDVAGVYQFLLEEAHSEPHDRNVRSARGAPSPIGLAGRRETTAKTAH